MPPFGLRGLPIIRWCHRANSTNLRQPRLDLARIGMHNLSLSIASFQHSPASRNMTTSHRVVDGANASHCAGRASP